MLWIDKIINVLTLGILAARRAKRQEAREQAQRIADEIAEATAKLKNGRAV